MALILKRLSLLLVIVVTSTPAVPGAEPYRDARLPTQERVRDLLGRMTLEEKIEQLTQKDAGRIEMQGDQADLGSLEKLFGDRSPGVLCVKFGDDLQQTAHQADVAIVVLGDTSMILSGVGWEDPSLPVSGTVGEGYDVTDPAPPGVQQDLVREVLKAGKPVVMVFLNGRPYSVPWMNQQVPAIVEAFYPGQQQGYAVADVLLGHVNPSGRLSMTVPQSAGHIPTVHDYKPSGRGYYHKPGSETQLGRDYVFSSPAPLWPFGFGLSYTTFCYSDLQIETPVIQPEGTVRLNFVVTNTGRRSGKDVPQVYLRDDVSSVTTPEMKLVGFTKIELQPGEGRRLEITIPNSELALWNRQMKRVVEPGSFTLMVGSSAETIALRGGFQVAAAVDNSP